MYFARNNQLEASYTVKIISLWITKNGDTMAATIIGDSKHHHFGPKQSTWSSVFKNLSGVSKNLSGVSKHHIMDNQIPIFGDWNNHKWCFQYLLKLFETLFVVLRISGDLNHHKWLQPLYHHFQSPLLVIQYRTKQLKREEIHHAEYNYLNQ